MPVSFLNKHTGKPAPKVKLNLMPPKEDKPLPEPSEGLKEHIAQQEISKKYSRIVNLPPHLKQQIDDMIRAGYESSVVARTIQNDMNLHTDISEEGMRMYISRYRQEMIPLIEQVPVIGSALVERAKTKLFKDVELLEKMTHVIETQLDRIALDHEKEKKAKMSLMQNNNNISVCFKGMRDYGELAVKIGLLRKLGDELDDIHRERPTALLDAAMKDPDVRALVHHSLNTMIIDLEKDLVKENAIDATYEDGHKEDQA